MGALNPDLFIGLAVAAVAWAALFLGSRRWFWERAALSGAVIGGYAIAVQGDSLLSDLRLTPLNAALGAVAAGLLYGVFWAADQILLRFLPGLHAQVVDLYRIRLEGEPAYMPLILIVIGGAEELFWRGYVQAEAGLAVAVMGYALVLLWERKPVLMLAALVGGLWWGALFALTGSLAAAVISHLLWDLMIVVWFPLHEVRDE